MKRALVIVTILLDVVLTAASAIWLIDVRIWGGVAPDIITPLLVLPLALAVMLSWILIAFVAYRSTRPPRPSWVSLLVLVALGFSAGAIAMECKIEAEVEELAAKAWGMRDEWIRNVRMEDEPIAGLVAMNLVALAYIACALAMRKPASHAMQGIGAGDG